MQTMNKGIFYTTRAIGGREGQNLSRHIAIIGSKHDEVDFLTGNSTDSSRLLIQKFGNILPKRSLNLFGPWYASDAKSMDDWMQVYERMDVSSLKDYSGLYLVGGLDLHRSNLGRSENRVGVFPRDRGQLKFESAGIHLTNILALLKAHNTYGIPLHEIAFDPNEMSMDLFHKDVAPTKDYHLYHGYDIPLYNAKRLDSLQYYFSSLGRSPTHSLFDEEIDKVYDFTFGYTILKNSGREHYPEYINSLAENFKNCRLYVKNEYTNENSHVDNDRYLAEIEKSRYTFMLPSYNKHCFSNYRFVESLHHDCLPLIHPDCNIEDVSKSFDVDLSVLIRTKPFSEVDRLELLEVLKKKMLSVEKLFR
jgi:hypothetical protein